MSQFYISFMLEVLLFINHLKGLILDRISRISGSSLNRYHTGMWNDCQRGKAISLLRLWSDALLKVNVSGSTTIETVLIVTGVLESCTSFTNVWDFHNNPHNRLLLPRLTGASRRPAYQTKLLNSNSLLRARFTSTSINQLLLTGLRKPK